MAFINPLNHNLGQVIRAFGWGVLRAGSTALGLKEAEQRFTDKENAVVDEAGNSSELLAKRREETATRMASEAQANEASKIEQTAQRVERAKVNANVSAERKIKKSEGSVVLKEHEVRAGVATHADNKEKGLIDTQGKDDKKIASKSAELRSGEIHASTTASITDQLNASDNRHQNIQDKAREKKAERTLEGLEARSESLEKLSQTLDEIQPLQAEVAEKQTATLAGETVVAEAARAMASEFLTKMKDINQTNEATHTDIQATVVESARHSFALDVITYQAKLAIELVGLKGELEKVKADHQLKLDTKGAKLETSLENKYQSVVSNLENKILKAETKQKIFAKECESKVKIDIGAEETKALVKLVAKELRADSFEKTEAMRSDVGGRVAESTASGASSARDARKIEGLTNDILKDNVDAENGFSDTQGVLNEMVKSHPEVLQHIVQKAVQEKKAAADVQPVVANDESSSSISYKR